MGKTQSIDTVTLKNWLDTIISNCDGINLAIQVESEIIMAICHALHPALHCVSKRIL